MRPFIYIILFFLYGYPCYSQDIVTGDNTTDFQIANLRSTVKNERIEDSMKVVVKLPVKKDTSSAIVKIYKIDKVKHAYIITVHDTLVNKYYEIVSLKERKRKPAIKEGQYYNIKFWPYFDVDIVSNHAIQNIVKINNKRIIVPSTSITGNLYLSNNFKGLVYSPD